MENDILNIKKLIASRDPINIELAMQLAKALDLDVNEVLCGYRILLKLKEEEPLSIDLLLEAKYWMMLDLSGLGLTEIPEEIAYFYELNSLDLSDNKLTDLPASMINIKELQALNLNNNQFRTLPNLVYQLPALHQLNCNYNPLHFFNPGAGQLQLVSRLSLRGCKLLEFPLGLCFENSKLIKLDVGENRFENLPQEIKHLQNLHYLHLDSNRLKSLPEEIALRSLQELDLSRNPFLKKMPDDLHRLKSLANLYLSGTPIENMEEVQRQLPWTEIWV